MQEENKSHWWSSSMDPTKIAATLKGALTLIIGIAGVFGVDVPDTLADEIVTVAIAGIGAAYMIFGLIRKIVIFFRDRG